MSTAAAAAALRTPSPLGKDAWRSLRSELLALREQLHMQEQRAPATPPKAAAAACSICHDEMGARALFTTSCGHTFHFTCIKRLAVEFAGEAVASRCPLCRADFSCQTPPRTPLAERTAGLPGFVTASSVLAATSASAGADAPGGDGAAPVPGEGGGGGEPALPTGAGGGGAASAPEPT